MVRPNTDNPAWAIVAFVQVLAIATNTAAVTVITPECILDDDGTNPLIERCLRKGDRFVEKYLRHVRTNKRWEYFNTCTEFLEFADCISPMMEKCPSVQRSQRHWRVIYDTMKCVCNETTGCARDLACFEEQYSGVLARRCDAYYRFNLRQKSRDRCHFIKENVLCKEALVRSACGPSAGELAFHLFKLSSRKHVRKRMCVIPFQAESQYEGFSYNDQCPTAFPRRMEECHATHISGTQLTFHDDNDLVVVAKRKDVKRACRSFREYKRCTRPIKDTCSRGARIIYEYDGRLRTYLLKLDYICNNVRDDYMHHMGCYREVLRNASLERCDATWKVLQPLLNSITANEFYCQPKANATRHLQRVLDKLRSCYEDVFRDGCGDGGGDVIGGLMRRVFHDPYYLRFKYMPDCKLHRAPAPAPRLHRPVTTVPVPRLTADRTAERSVSVLQPGSSGAAGFWSQLHWTLSVTCLTSLLHVTSLLHIDGR